jgi:hypothetical protein
MSNTWKILLFDVNTDEINNCKPIDSETYRPTDCTINVMEFLKIIDKNVALDLSKLTNTVSKSGTTNAQLLQFVSQKLPSYRIKDFSFYDLNNLENPFTQFNFDNFDKLEANKAIICLFQNYKLIDGKKKYVMGHAVIMAKDIYSNLYIIDRQSNKQINVTNYEDFQKYMYNNNYNEIYTLFYKLKSVSKKKNIHNRNETTIQIRKPSKSSQNKTKKQKREQNFIRINRKRKNVSKENESVKLRKKKSNISAKIKKVKKSVSTNEDDLIQQFSKLRIES